MIKTIEEFVSHMGTRKPGEVIPVTQEVIEKLSVLNTLSERGNRYGTFKEHARITQQLKDTMVSGRSWESCSPSQKEALEMIVHKIGRIVNGDPNYADSWHDIVGYAKLVDDELNGKIQ